MKQFFEPSPSRRANVWLDEAPPADFTATSSVKRVVQTGVVVPATRRLAGVEMNIHHGPRASYGLLGAELVEANIDGLEVIVSVNKFGFPFPSSLALQPDEVKVELLDEYAEAVIRGVATAAGGIGTPTGASLVFRWAAHGIVGSSPAMFERVSAIVVRLLALQVGASDEQILMLLR